MNGSVETSPVSLVQDFVNTFEPQTGQESLSSTTALNDWLLERGLMPPGSIVTDADVATAVAIREGLRNVLLSHADHPSDPEETDALERLLATLPVKVSLAGSDLRLVSLRPDPISTALVALLDAVRRSTEDGTWLRLKVCARDTCRWAFYDASRNHARRWCSMAGCGNSVKMRRAYASRKARTSTAPSTSH